jgi:catechol 2,3-dioxygenase-like lactoylglutathione lyase family enzyme
MAPPDVPAPMLRYAGSDIAALQAEGLELQQDERGLASFTTPKGLHIMLSPHTSRVPMPAGSPIERSPLSRCGKFGEYALPVVDLQAAIAYWETLGFATLHVAEEPSPFAILSDDLIVIGLHKTDGFSVPHITYFAPDMPERIQALQTDGIKITPLPPQAGEPAGNAVFQGPGGERFFLFQGSI